MRLRLCALASLSLLASGALSQPNTLAVSSDAWTLTVDAATGVGLSLRDSGGHEYVNGTPTSLFRLQVTDSSGRQRWVSSHDAARVTVHATAAGLEVHCAGVGGERLGVRIAVEPEGVALLFRIELQPAGGAGEQGAIVGREIAMEWDAARTGITLAVNYIGLLDELADFRRPLSPAEIRTLATEPAALTTLRRK